MVMVVMVVVVTVASDHDHRPAAPMAVVVMMRVMVVILGELNVGVGGGGLALVNDLEHRRGVWDGLQQVGIGVGLQRVRRGNGGWRRLRGRHRAGSSYGSQKSGNLLFHDVTPNARGTSSGDTQTGKRGNLFPGTVRINFMLRCGHLFPIPFPECAVSCAAAVQLSSSRY